MRLPYIRLGAGLPTEAAQRKALRDAGLSDDDMAEPYIDKPKTGAMAWEHLLGNARTEGGEPDEVCIARPAILAASAKAALDRLAELTEQGAILFVASTGRRYRWHKDAAEAVSFAAEITADERAVVLEKARAAIKRRPGNPTHTDNRWTVAAQLWADPKVTAKEAAERTGIGARHLYRKLGPKGTAPFTGGPRKRGKR